MLQHISTCPASVGVPWRLSSPADSPGGWALLVSVLVALVAVAPPFFHRQRTGGRWRGVAFVTFCIGGLFLLVAVALSALVGPALSQDSSHVVQSFVAPFLEEPGASLQAVLPCALAEARAQEGYLLAREQVTAACFASTVLCGVACFWLSFRANAPQSK